MDGQCKVCSTSCPLCICNRRKRSQHRGHRYYRNTAVGPVRRRVFNVRKPDTANGGDSGAAPCLDGEFASSFPLVCEYLTQRRYDDGTERELSSLTFFYEDTPKVSLADKDARRSVYVSGADWYEALKTLERALRAGAIEWRAWKERGKKK